MTEQTQNTLLPRGVNDANLQQALAKFRKLLGEDNVLVRTSNSSPTTRS